MSYFLNEKFFMKIVFVMCILEFLLLTILITHVRIFVYFYLGTLTYLSSVQKYPNLLVTLPVFGNPKWSVLGLGLNV